MNQITNLSAKKYVAPDVDVFKMEHEAIMTASGSTEKLSTSNSISRRRGTRFEDEE
jgi:hypothetical protein